jgi:hypothetical protein
MPKTENPIARNQSKVIGPKTVAMCQNVAQKQCRQDHKCDGYNIGPKQRCDDHWQGWKFDIITPTFFLSRRLPNASDQCEIPYW